MEKIKYTKGELKRKRDALRQYRRYLPTLALKKLKLQMEILHQFGILEEKRKAENAKRNHITAWAGLLADSGVDLRKWLIAARIIVGSRNIAGVELPCFEKAFFGPAEYDLFIMPLWVDAGLEELRGLVSAREEIKVIEKGLEILRHELRIATQRVNLFEKVKIPQAEEAIRRIKIYIGDQMTNAVGRSKIAKRKIEKIFLRDNERVAA